MEPRHEGFVSIHEIPLGWEPLITVDDEDEAVAHYRRANQSHPAGIVAEIDRTFTVWVEVVRKWPNIPHGRVIRPKRFQRRNRSSR